MTFSWHDADQLSAEIRALAALDPQSLEQAQTDFLVDACIPGAPVLISFAFVDWEKPANFYLFGRSKKLEQLTGQKLNRILLRDRSNQWYLRGIPGLGDSVDEVVQRLRLLISALQGSAVWCIGESMGGYGAIMHGLMLQADRIVSFGALSSFSPAFAEQYGDRRWLGTMKNLPEQYRENSDLPILARRKHFRGVLHLIQGASAGPDAPDAVSLDIMHSRRYADLSCVRFHDYPDAQHAVTFWLVQNKLFDGILLHCLFDHPDPAPLPALPRAKPAAGGPALKHWPDQFPALDANALATESDVAVHAITPRATLMICFADLVKPGEPATFDMFDERRQAEQIIGKPLNQILLRDSYQQAWLRGCKGMGNDVESVAANLRKLIARMSPARVVCIGQGIGGFAALLFAELLGADEVLAFNPLTLLDIRFADLWHDKRHRHLLSAIEQAPVAPAPRDLLPVLRRYRGRALIVCATLGQGSGYDLSSHHSVHAQRVAMLPNVQVQPLPSDGDALEWLRERNLVLILLGLGRNERANALAQPASDYTGHAQNPAISKPIENVDNIDVHFRLKHTQP